MLNLTSFNVLSVAVIAILVGLVLLVTMVHYELGPKGDLARGGQWLLATALGTGILALVVKLVIILTLVNFPGAAIEPFIRKTDSEPLLLSQEPLLRLLGSKRFVWSPLPDKQNGSTQVVVKVATAAPPYIWEALPLHAPAPDDNPTSDEKIALGKQLFFDKNLSRDRTLSCSSCHDVLGGSGDDSRSTSMGIEGQLGGRNSPTVWNAAFQSVLFWDGRASSLEDQAKGPLVNPIEMGMPSLAEVEARVRADRRYSKLFAQAFGVETEIGIDQIAQAIAAYERTLITPDTPCRLPKGSE